MISSMARVLFLAVALPLVACAGSSTTVSISDSKIGQVARVQHHECSTPLDHTKNPNRRDIFKLNKLLGRGINLSGLEQAKEGDWSFKLRNDALSVIADGEFNSVRLPIKWDSHAATIGSNASGTFEIEQKFFDRVDSVLDDALSLGLRVIINMHLYEDLINDPVAEAGRFLDLWNQIAKHYADKSDCVYFEILNEPAGVFIDQPQLWNNLLKQALDTIRVSNPDRAVLIGPVGWNLIENLYALKLPDDNRLIVSVHYYDPGHFTHQGAEWIKAILPVGVKWFPLQQRLGGDLQDWSWGAEMEFLSQRVDVTFARSGAALNIYTQPKYFPSSISVKVQGEAQMAVICSAGKKFTDTHVRIIHNSANWATFTADLSNCPDNANQIALQNLLEGGGVVRLSGGDFCNAQSCSPFFLSQDDAIEMAFDAASRWGESNRRPMNLGEFGAYKTADMASRVRWTTAVQAAAQTRDMSSHYWEFEQGFGVWDRESGHWIAPLYRALQR